jgi:hypothetical protein
MNNKARTSKLAVAAVCDRRRSAAIKLKTAFIECRYSFVIQASSFVRHSSFVIRHFPS